MEQSLCQSISQVFSMSRKTPLSFTVFLAGINYSCCQAVIHSALFLHTNTLLWGQVLLASQKWLSLFLIIVSNVLPSCEVFTVGL